MIIRYSVNKILGNEINYQVMNFKFMQQNQRDKTRRQF